MNAVNINVKSMNSMTSIFDVAGNSMATLENIIVHDIDFTFLSPSLLWTAVDVRDNAMASVSSLIVRDSTNIRHLISAQSYSMVNVLNSVTTDLFGGHQVVSFLTTNR